MRGKIDRFLKNVLFQADGRERLGLLLASERSGRDTYRGKNEKIGDVCLLASERSERDSIRGG